MPATASVSVFNRRACRQPSLGTIANQTEQMAQTLFRASRLLNSNGTDSVSRKRLRQTWEEAEETFTSLAGLLHHGVLEVSWVQRLVEGEVSNFGGEMDPVVVSGILREIWRQIEWLGQQERPSSTLFSLERISRDLLHQARQLNTLIEENSFQSTT